MANKRLPKGISIRKDGRYQARYTLNGKRHTIYGKTLKEVEKKLRDAQYEIDHGIYAKPDRITVDSWYEAWTKEYRENFVRENTLAADAARYKHMKAAIGHMKLQAVRPEHLQGIINRMAKEGYAACYVAHVRDGMHKMFEQAFLNGIIAFNPVSRTVLPKMEKGKNPHRRALAEWEQERFLECVARKKPFYADIFYVGFSTGMRIGEIRALEWSDIDFKNMEIHVRGTLIKPVGKEYFKGEPKTACSIRTVPMLPAIAERLKKHKAAQARMKLAMGERWKPAEGLEYLVFCTKFGKPINEPLVLAYIKTVVGCLNREEEKRAAEEKREPVTMERFCPHAMRHTFATRALEKGIPPRVVQEYLGHASVEITMDVYTHVTKELETEEIKKLADQFG
ncbi:MAG: site-specific integrase [Acetatifactor muris]|nr:site-specific integrase [Acetatifactor muris]